MDNNTKRAVVAIVPILEIEGLMMPNGDFAIGVSQIAGLNLVPPNRSLKQLEALSGMDFPFAKWKTELNSKPVNVIALEDFDKLLVNLVAKGHVPAIELWNKAYPDKAVAVPKPKGKANQVKGYVYVFEANNAIKVGFAKDVESRLQTLQRWPGELELIIQIKGGINKEQKIHRCLHNTGESFGKEWYPLHRKQEIIALVQSLA